MLYRNISVFLWNQVAPVSRIYQPSFFFFFLHDFTPKNLILHASLAHLAVQSGCDKHCIDFLGCSEKQD